MESKKQTEVKKQEKKYHKYTIDLNEPISNNLFALESVEKYLLNNFKVNGLKGKLGDSIKVDISNKLSGQKNVVTVFVDDKLQFSKSYIKYLTKKFLKREGIVNYLNILATAPNAYTVKIIKKNEQ